MRWDWVQEDAYYPTGASPRTDPLWALPGRLRWALRRAGYRTPEDLAAATDRQLLLVYGMGETRLRQLRALLAAAGHDRR